MLDLKISEKGQKTYFGATENIPTKTSYALQRSSEPQQGGCSIRQDSGESEIFACWKREGNPDLSNAAPKDD